MHNMAPIPGPLPLTDEWYEARYTGIFASEAAVACGLSDRRQPLDLYAEKRRLVSPFEGNEFTEAGHEQEPIILRRYEKMTGHEVERNLPMFFHPVAKFMGATPDGRRRASIKHLVEAKLCHWKRAAQLGEEGSDDVLPEWNIQAQQQMAVMDAEACDICVMIDAYTFRLYTVERNERLIEDLIEVETELWDRIVRGDPPEPLFDKPGALDAVRRFFGISGKPIALSEGTIREWLEVRRLNEEIEELEKIRDELKARVLHAIGEAPSGRFPRGTHELARVVVQESMWTQTDVDVAIKSLGTVKRRGYVRLIERKVKR